MTTVRKHILIALAVLGMGSTTLAAQAHENHDGKVQGQQAGEHRARHMDPQARQQRWAKRAERAAERRQKLHAALMLTPAQEGAWASYTAATAHRGKGDKAAAGQRPDRAAWAAMPAPQRMETRLSMAKQRLARMEARVAATSNFYAVLTPEQRKVFDANSAGQRRHGKHRQLRG